MAEGAIGGELADSAGQIVERLRGGGVMLLTAPPGAGKSTVLPLHLLNSYKGKILMLEPRRIAARQIASRLASQLGEPAGRTVGYQIRFEKRVLPLTRLEILTEGILTRRLVEDPALEGVELVIFDEFHERGLNSDLALALCRSVREILRPDLNILIMSATMDVDALGKALGAVTFCCGGRQFPVSTEYSTSEATPENVVERVTAAVRKAHSEQSGDILAFLPGEGEIRRCAEALGSQTGDTQVYPLYGMLPDNLQKAAIAPSAPGTRKIVLATPVAETSLTIEGVRTVVDSGLCRRSVFDARTGLGRLETVRISLDMATQREGRAGRVAPGVCYKLWSRALEARMEAMREPEILSADLSSTVLQIAAWGGRAEDLTWLTPPPSHSLSYARNLLQSLGAIDPDGRITSHGRALAAFPCHPRIAQMLLRADTPELKALACDIAAVVEEKDPLPESCGCGIDLRVDALRRARRNKTLGAFGRIERAAAQYRGMVRVQEDNSAIDPYQAGALLSAAWPLRIAKAGDAFGRFFLTDGSIVSLDQSDALSSAGWLAVASLNVRPGGVGRVFLAAPLDESDLEAFVRERDIICWDSREEGVTARRERRVGNLLLSSRPLSGCDESAVLGVLCDAARTLGRSMFTFDDDFYNLSRRVGSAAAWHPELGIPVLGIDELLSRAPEWLPLYYGGALTAARLRKIDMSAVLWGLLDYSAQQAVERIAPSYITVPTGSRIRLLYRQGAEVPVARVRLQECFGMKTTPTVDGGKRPVLMELLSPGFKPVQLTTDLESFWRGTYFEVRSELRRRYPKHSWPDDPLTAPPVRGTRR